VVSRFVTYSGNTQGETNKHNVAISVVESGRGLEWLPPFPHPSIIFLISGVFKLTKFSSSSNYRFLVLFYNRSYDHSAN